MFALQFFEIRFSSFLIDSIELNEKNTWVCSYLLQHLHLQHFIYSSSSISFIQVEYYVISEIYTSTLNGLDIFLSVVFEFLKVLQHSIL